MMDSSHQGVAKRVLSRYRSAKNRNFATKYTEANASRIPLTINAPRTLNLSNSVRTSVDFCRQGIERVGKAKIWCCCGERRLSPGRISNPSSLDDRGTGI